MTEIPRQLASTLRYPAYGGDFIDLGSEPKVFATRVSDGTKFELGKATKVSTGLQDGDAVHYTRAITAAQAPDVDGLSLTWGEGTAIASDACSVVGGFACALNAITAKLGEDRPDGEVELAREIATIEIEAAVGFCFRERLQVERVNGTGQRLLTLRGRNVTRLLSVKLGELAPVTLSAGELAEIAITDPEIGVLLRPSGWPVGIRNVQIMYVGGIPGYVTASGYVRDYAAYLLTAKPTDWNARATAIATEFGSYSLVTPGRAGAQFPLPELNAFVDRFREALVA